MVVVSISGFYQSTSWRMIATAVARNDIVAVIPDVSIGDTPTEVLATALASDGTAV